MVCDTIRPPHAAFCPKCGAAFDGSVGAGRGALSRREVDIPFWTAVKVGAGFTLGASVLAIGVWVGLAVLLLVGISLPARP
jgi:hypothetical protein